MKKLKVGFFGGCFNPPSKIHTNLARKLIENGILDKVIFVPVGDYYKKQNLVEAKHRYNMLSLLCNAHECFAVEDIAVKSEKNLYAADTFKLIYNKYCKDIEIYLIMGSDNFKKMNNWKAYNEIINKYRYIVIERPNYIEKTKADNIIYCELEQREDFSSTRIRNLLKKGEDTSNYLDNRVFQYIKQNNLYV